jgi:chemotaxis protein histidine kinase CheA
MSTNPSASFLDFFVLEASEYVERLDGLLLRATPTGPDSEAVQRAARALRGSATMARLPGFAELASAVEGVGRALREGQLGWDQALKGALTTAVDDLKILVRAARAWSPAEDQWAAARVAELRQFVAPMVPSAVAPMGTNVAFFGSEATTLATELEQLAANPADRDGAMNALQRVRALRGVAGVNDVHGLSNVSEATESALRSIEQGADKLSPERVTLLRSAANLLRAIAAETTGGPAVTVDSAPYRAFLMGLDAMMAEVSGADRVLPIADLFYNDAGPHIVSAAANPPTTPSQRFRMEVVSLGEHLHRVIEDARRATDDIQREHARGQLGRALRAIRATAASFGQMAVAQTVEAYLERTGDLNVSALDAISSFAATISPASTAPTPVAQPSVQPLRHSEAQRAVSTIGFPQAQRPAAAAAAAAPAAASAVPQAGDFAPAGTNSLDAAISSFDSLSEERLAEPVELADEPMPVDYLFYRGRMALERAVEVRDELRRAGGAPAPELLEELYDLVELARTD